MSAYTYPDAEVLKKYPDGKKLLYLCGKEGLATVGRYHMNCLGDHHFWACGQYIDPPLEYFFLITHKDGTPGILVHSKLYEWFRKPHPTDGTPEHLANVTYMRPGFLTSTSYDELYPAGEARGYSPQEREAHISQQMAKYDRIFEEARTKYERFRAQAIRLYGPLGQYHPLKHEVDKVNRAVSKAKEAREEQMRAMRLFRGRLFTFRDKELILLSTTAKGIDYDASDTRYGNQLDEFMRKDNVIVSDSA